MSARGTRFPGFPGGLLELSLGATLTALSLVLHLFKLPYPPVSFLKFDGMGIALAALALYSLRTSVAALPIVFVGLQLMGADFVGAGMKVIAETSTFVPLVYGYRWVGSRRSPVYYSLPIALGMVSRTLVMSLCNYLVTPHWLVLIGFSFEKAYAMTIGLLPHVAIFNLIAASYVGALSIGVFKVISKTFGAETLGRVLQPR